MSPGSSILTRSPDSRNGKKRQKNGNPENPTLEEGAIIHHLGKWCIAPCRGGLRCRSGRRRTNIHWTLCALRTADNFHRFSICSNHHRGSYPSPVMAPPATPLWTCRWNLFALPAILSLTSFESLAEILFAIPEMWYIQKYLKLPIDPHGTSWVRVDISRTGGRQL